MQQVNIPILIALICYGIFMACIALYWMMKVKNTEDFLMARRGLGIFPLFGTILATSVGTGVTLGASGLAYRSGWGGCLYPLGLGTGLILTAVIFSEMRTYKFMTMSEEIACYYDGNKIISEFSSIALFLSKACWLTVQIMGGGFILGLVTGLPLKVCIIISGVLIASTAIPGGLLSVVYTDVVQAFVFMAGFAVLTVYSLEKVGGFSGLKTQVPPGYFSFLGIDVLGWKTALAIPPALIIGQLTDTNNRQRIYSAASTKTAYLSMAAAGSINIIFSIPVAMAGMLVYAINPDLTRQDQAIPWLAINVLPTWLAAMIVISITAAIFSSGNSDAAVSGTFYIRHIYPLIFGRYPKKPLRTSRLMIVVLFIVSTTLALFAGTIVDFVVNFLSVLLSGLAVVVLLGKYWKRATWQGAVAAVIVGAMVSFIVIYVPEQNEFWEKPIIPATLAALVAEVFVSLATCKPKKSIAEVAAELEEVRKGID